MIFDNKTAYYMNKHNQECLWINCWDIKLENQIHKYDMKQYIKIYLIN